MKKYCIFSALFLISFTIFSSTTNYFSSIYQNFFEGKTSGVVVFKNGSFKPLTDYSDSISFQATPVASFSTDSAIYIGTTSESSILKIVNGKSTKIATFEEPIVSALFISGETIFAGTASPARLYTVKQNGEKKLLKDFETDIVNAILLSPKGDLVVATGKPAKLFLISSVGEVRCSVSLPADHCRTLFFYENNYYIGTATPASLYRFDSKMTPLLLYTFDGQEVTNIANLKENLLISVNSKKDTEKAKIFIYSEKGGTEEIENFDTLINSLWSNRKEILIGGNNGCLYYYGDNKIGLLKKFEKPIIQLAGNIGFPKIIFSSPPSMAEPLRSNNMSYTSPVIDAQNLSKVGFVKTESSNSVKIFLRAGNNPIPDIFWTSWVLSADLNSLPSSRYFQWKVEFLEKPETFKGVTITLKSLNRSPKIESVKIHPPGEIYVKNISQLGDRLVQDIHEKERAFPEIAMSRPSDMGTQTYYLYGFRMVSFSVSDPDGDDVRVKIEIKPDASIVPFTLTENLKENFFTFDARTLPDGIYTIILTASDRASNSKEEALTDTYETPLIEIDNTPPTISLKQELKETLKLFVKDNTSIRGARLSRNGDVWQYLESDEKRFGSNEANFSIQIEKEDRWIVFQAVDSYGNMSNFPWVRKD